MPKLIDEVNGFVDALPNYVHDLTHGRGRLGFLETKYHVVEKVRQQVKEGGAKRLLGLSGAALSITKSVITVVAASITIVFLTFFMLLEGGGWAERFYQLFPEESQPRLRTVGARHLSHRRRLRDGQHPDQPDRRGVDHDRAPDPRRPVRRRARAARRGARPRTARGCDDRRDRRRDRRVPALGAGGDRRGDASSSSTSSSRTTSCNP